MRIEEIEDILKSFNWEILKNMYGCAHSSIIGFISTEWIHSSPKDNFILDGAPSPITGRKRKGQKNADILLCKKDGPLIPVEVETNVSKYYEKLGTLHDYLTNKNEFDGIDFGFLFMTNNCNGSKKFQHNWDSIKKRIRKKSIDIALVSIEKERKNFDKDTTLNRLRKRNDYYPWNIVTCDYWICKDDQITEGNLFSNK